jgi:hypothetical protein
MLHCIKTADSTGFDGNKQKFVFIFAANGLTRFVPLLYDYSRLRLEPVKGIFRIL